MGSTEGLIPEVVGCKKRLVQVMRNPLDTFVSSWHHICGKGGYKGSWDRFFEKVVLEDAFENGSWFEYHEEFFKAHDEGKIEVLFLKYEETNVTWMEAEWAIPTITNHHKQVHHLRKMKTEKVGAHTKLITVAQ